MTAYVALLRAVNVGGTGKLAMNDLKRLAIKAGLRGARTYIASGNLVFESDDDEAKVRSDLEALLAAHAGKPVAVIVRSGSEMADIARRNPFAGRAGNRTIVHFTDEPLGAHILAQVSGVAEEELRLGERAIYIWYGEGMANSRLRLPALKRGTARNMNTVEKLAAMAAEK